MKPKLAIIGCGGIGTYHLDHFVKFDDIELAGFCDVIPSRAEAFVKKAGSGRAFGDVAEMYDAVQPDMVFICIPPYAHGLAEFETIKRGIPFFVEKPLSLDPALAREILNQVERRGLIAASGFQCRYDDINIPAKQFVRDNKIVHVAASRIGGMVDVPWWRNKYLSGGQLVEQTVHQLDMLRYLLDDEPDTVYSVAGQGIISQEETPGYFSDDISTTLITFKSGLTCTMVTGCYSSGGASWDNKMTFGSRDSRMDYRLITDVTIYQPGATSNLGGLISGDGMQRSGGGAGIVTKTGNDFGTICDRTFIDAVISGDASKVRSLYDDAYKSVMFALACNESMETGMPIKVMY